MWVHFDPECGVYLETKVDEEDKKYFTQFPRYYVEVPRWYGLLLMVISTIHRSVQKIAYRYRPKESNDGQGNLD